MASAENEIFEFVVVVMLVAIVAVAIWLYFQAKQFDPSRWIQELMAAIANLIKSLEHLFSPNVSSSPGSGIATGSGGSGSGAYQVLINSSQGNWSTPPLGG